MTSSLEMPLRATRWFSHLVVLAILTVTLIVGAFAVGRATAPRTVVHRTPSVVQPAQPSETFPQCRLGRPC